MMSNNENDNDDMIAMKILQTRENEQIILINEQMLNAVCRNWHCCVVNVITVVDWADSIAWLNAQQFDSDYQELEIDCDFSQDW